MKVALFGLVGLAVVFAQLDWQGLALVVGAIGTAAVVIIRAIGEVQKELAIVRQEFMAVKEDVSTVKGSMSQVEKHTNSITDELSKVKELYGLAQGELKGRSEKAAEIKQETADAKAESLEAKIVTSPDTVTAPKPPEGWTK